MNLFFRRAYLVLLLLPCFLVAESLPPDEAFKKLMDGNNRFVEQQRIHPNQSERRREMIVNGQTPFAMIMSCSDSRVPPEIIFDAGIGDLFISRVAGNVVGGIEMETIEYATLVLNVQMVMVLGHQNCGAVKVALEDPKLAENIPIINGLIQPHIKESRKKNGDCLSCAIKLNAIGVKKQLQEDKLFKSLIESGKLKIVAGYYDLETGKVLILD